MIFGHLVSMTPTGAQLGGGRWGRAPPPSFYTLTKDMSKNGGATTTTVIGYQLLHVPLGLVHTNLSLKNYNYFFCFSLQKVEIHTHKKKIQSKR